MHSKSVTTNATTSNKVITDFQFWLDVSSKKATPYHLHKKERRALVSGMAKTYLRLHGMPNIRVLYNYRYTSHFVKSGKFAAKKSLFILPSLVWFMLSGIAGLLKKQIMRPNRSAVGQKDNRAVRIKCLFPAESCITGRSKKNT
jgi:hypothetical protein